VYTYIIFILITMYYFVILFNVSKLHVLCIARVIVSYPQILLGIVGL